MGLRLLQAGVAAEIHNFPGAYHGSEVVETAEISRRRLADIDWALRHGLNGWSGADIGIGRLQAAVETGEPLA